MVNVKLIQLNGPVREFNVDDNPTVAGLMEKAGLNFVQGNISINHNMVNPDTILNDGDRVLYGSAVKGNLPFEVKFVCLGANNGENVSMAGEDGMTIDQVAAQMNQDVRSRFVNPTNGEHIYEYRIAGSSGPAVDPKTYRLSPPASGTIMLLLAQKMKGNKKK